MAKGHNIAFAALATGTIIAASMLLPINGQAVGATSDNQQNVVPITVEGASAAAVLPIMVSEPVVQAVPAVVTEDVMANDIHSDAEEPAPREQIALDDDTICLAKIVHHESANQPVKGQMAVAQVVMNRLASPKFPKTICGIALQRNQFFNVHAYNPPKDKRWDLAVQIAMDARAGTSEPVVGEALFFHAAYANPPFFRGRPRVAQIGDHIFYR